jgi:hypothetical protein
VKRQPSLPTSAHAPPEETKRSRLLRLVTPAQAITSCAQGRVSEPAGSVAPMKVSRGKANIRLDIAPLSIGGKEDLRLVAPRVPASPSC